MEEKQLEILFKKYLLTKGYPQGSLLSKITLRTTGEGAFRPDLVILDIYNKEYIGVVEFKTKIDERIKVNAVGQLLKYLSLLGAKRIPGYLVIPHKEDDFEILVLNEDNTFKPIDKEEFPTFEILSAKRLTEEKIKQRDLEEKTLAELQQKKRRSKQSAYLALLSLLLGVSVSVIGVFFQQRGFGRPDSHNVQCCDSLASNLNKLQQSTRYLQNKILLNANHNGYKDAATVSSSFALLESRLKIIETGISENPEKTLSILQIRQDIEILKKADDYSRDLTQSKIDSLKNEIDVQNTWITGVLIAIFGTVLSLVIPNLLTKRNE